MTGNIIMLIDDDKTFNMLTSMVIKRYITDAKLQIYASALSALEYIEANVGNPSALPVFIFLDIRMPQIDGFEFLEQLNSYNQEHIQHIRVAMLTSSLYNTDREKAFSYKQVKYFLEKPLLLQKLKELDLGLDLC
jgi:CheY-like chemotaxis protein